jgi:hypothetical protein
MRLAHAEIVDAFHGRATLTADQCMAISTDQRFGERFGARRAVEFGTRLGFGHAGYYATESTHEKNLLYVGLGLRKWHISSKNACA